ncbi:MAG: lamin tail domain-containing protein [Candidatus Eisenbacteria bacterium]|nr:lamin tail domain-containing protein [Candidatus Eisenbacteria bacterium]
MRRFAFTILHVLVVVLFLALSAGFCSAQLVINEILASPSIDWNGDGGYTYRDDEWVEVYNNTEGPIVLDGYRLADAETTWRYGFSGVLPARGYLVVYGSDSYAWEKAHAYPAYGLSLSNTGDAVQLWQFVGVESVQVGCYAYGKNAAGTDRSVGRKPDGVEDWYIFDALNPYTGTTPPVGTGCPPSPGTANGCTTPVEGETWGRIKTLFK